MSLQMIAIENIEGKILFAPNDSMLQFPQVFKNSMKYMLKFSRFK
jgi:hypothetical protein